MLILKIQRSGKKPERTIFILPIFLLYCPHTSIALLTRTPSAGTDVFSWTESENRIRICTAEKNPLRFSASARALTDRRKINQFNAGAQSIAEWMHSHELSVRLWNLHRLVFTHRSSLITTAPVPFSFTLVQSCKVLKLPAVHCCWYSPHWTSLHIGLPADSHTELDTGALKERVGWTGFPLKTHSYYFRILVII